MVWACETKNAKRRVILPPVAAETPFSEGWTAVVVPIDCNFAGWRNAGPVTVQQSTDPDNADSFDELQPGWSDLITAPTEGAPRLPKNTVLIFLRVVGGTEPGDVRFHFVW